MGEEDVLIFHTVIAFGLSLNQTVIDTVKTKIGILLLFNSNYICISFVFTLLLQQRGGKKVTWPLMWSNSVCGHTAPGEATEDAVKRRAQFELGLALSSLKFGAPYRYRFEREGVVENEVCPVYIATAEDEPNPNPDEVEATTWILWSEFLEEIKTNLEKYSEWCRGETLILEEKGLVRDSVYD